MLFQLGDIFARGIGVAAMERLADILAEQARALVTDCRMFRAISRVGECTVERRIYRLQLEADWRAAFEPIHQSAGLLQV